MSQILQLDFIMCLLFVLAIFPHFLSCVCLLFLSSRTMWSLVCIPPARPRGCLLSSPSWPPCTRARTLPWASSLKSRSICRSGNTGLITTWRPDPSLFKNWFMCSVNRFSGWKMHWNICHPLMYLALKLFKSMVFPPMSLWTCPKRCVLSHTLIQLLSDKSRRVILQDRCYYVCNNIHLI